METTVSTGNGKEAKPEGFSMTFDDKALKRLLGQEYTGDFGASALFEFAVELEALHQGLADSTIAGVPNPVDATWRIAERMKVAAELVGQHNSKLRADRDAEMCVHVFAPLRSLASFMYILAEIAKRPAHRVDDAQTFLRRVGDGIMFFASPPGTQSPPERSVVLDPRIMKDILLTGVVQHMNEQRQRSRRLSRKGKSSSKRVAQGKAGVQS